MKAASLGCVDSMTILLNHGADIYATDNEGNTAAHYAAFDNQLKAYLLLKQHGKCDVASEREDSTRTQSTRRTRHLRTMYTTVFVPKNKLLVLCLIA